MTFPTNSFDCVVDTFGLESNFDPKEALGEMKRVCREGGLIFLLENGLPDNALLRRLIEWKNIIYFKNRGSFSNVNWDRLIEESGDLEVVQKQKFYMGTLYYYILSNKKTPAPPKK